MFSNQAQYRTNQKKLVFINNHVKYTFRHPDLGGTVIEDLFVY